MTDERRLTTRMAAKWSAISGSGRLPRYADLDLEQFGKDVAHCAVIRLSALPGAAILLHVGRVLRNEGWSPERNQTVADYPPNSLIGLAVAKIPAMLAKRGTITFGGTGVNGVDAILYRAILLPLSDGGETIDHAIAAINFREITAVQEYSEEGTARPPAQAPDRVNDFIAFSSRKISFAPAVAKKPTPVIR